MYVNVRYVSTVRSVRSVTKAFTFIVSIGASWWLRLGGKEVAKEHIFFLPKSMRFYEYCIVLLHIATPDLYCQTIGFVTLFLMFLTFLL